MKKITKISLTCVSAILAMSCVATAAPKTELMSEHTVLAASTKQNGQNTITLANSVESGTEVYDKNGKQLFKNKKPVIIKAKALSYTGRTKYIRGPKIYYYSNRTDPLTPKYLPYFKKIKGKQYLYIGKGKYLLNDYTLSIYPLHRHAYITKNPYAKAYVYNSQGKKIRRAKKGEKFIFPGKFNKKFNQYHYNAQVYFEIGKNQYLKSSAVAKINDQPAFRLNHNSYIYNQDGKRIDKTTLRKTDIIASLKDFERVTDSDHKPLYFTWIYSTEKPNGEMVWIDYKTINGQQYYQIGKNQYIKAANVGSIQGEDLITTKPITVKLKKDSAIYTFNRDIADKTKKKVLKKGSKVTFDYNVSDYYYGESEDNTYYHIKGKDNEFIYGGNFSTRFNLYGTNWYGYYQLRTTARMKTINQAKLYNLNGELLNETLPAEKAVNVDRLQYLYLPTENRLELVYHLTTGLKGRTNNAFVKANDLTYISGAKIKAANTANEAQSNFSKIATSEEQAKLVDLINKADKIKKSFAYTQASSEYAKSYDQALTTAAKVNQDSKATVSQVEFIIWYLNKAANDLDGVEPTS